MSQTNITNVHISYDNLNLYIVWHKTSLEINIAKPGIRISICVKLSMVLTSSLISSNIHDVTVDLDPWGHGSSHSKS